MKFTCRKRNLAPTQLPGDGKVGVEGTSRRDKRAAEADSLHWNHDRRIMRRTGVCARARALTARTVRFHHRSTPVDQSVDARASPSGRYASRLDDQRAACPACVRYVSVPNAECQALSKRSLSVCVARLQPPARAARRGRGSSRVAHCETGARGAVDRVKPARWAHSPGVTRRDRTATRRPTEMHRARDASNEAVPEAIQAYHFM